MRRLNALLFVLLVTLAACAMPGPSPMPTATLVPAPTSAPVATAEPVPTPEPGPAPATLPPPDQINLDRATQTLIAHAKRTVFLMPFSHWDTDWHNSYPTYSRAAAANIITAIQIAKQLVFRNIPLPLIGFIERSNATHRIGRRSLAK